MIEKGRPWERPASGPPEWQVEGDDAALAAAVRDHPGARIEFRPAAGSDLARALGLHAAGETALELSLDGLRVVADDRELFAVNMVVVGVAPDRLRPVDPGAATSGSGSTSRVAHDGRATDVVVASGQYLRGADVVPAGPPGRRPGRGPGVRGAAGRAGRGPGPAAPGRPPPAPRHHPDHAAATSRCGPTGARSRSRSTAWRCPRAALVTVDVVPGAFVLVL